MTSSTKYSLASALLAVVLCASSNGFAQFVFTGKLHTARNAHSATLLPNGQVLIAGGEIGGFDTNTAELYNPATGTFSFTGNLQTARSSHTATLLPNGLVLIVGGSILSVAELYNPATGTFAYTGSLNIGPRAGHTATLLPNGQVLIVGGVPFPIPGVIPDTPIVRSRNSTIR